MCLLIFKRPEGKLSKQHIENAWENNPDGAGIAWANGGDGVYMKKGFMELKHLQEHIDKIEGRAAIVHFRWGNVGDKNEKNCHPFQAGGGWVVAHNGTVPDMDPKGGESDTKAFSRLILKPLLKHNPKILHEEYTRELLEKRIGAGSKMVFMNHSGIPIFLNEKDGKWEENVWYSNNSHRFGAIPHFYSDYYSGRGSLEFYPGKYGPEFISNTERKHVSWNEDGTCVESMCGGLFTRKVSLNGVKGKWEEHEERREWWIKNWKKIIVPDQNDAGWMARKRHKRKIRDLHHDPYIDIDECNNGVCDMCEAQFPGMKSFKFTKDKISLCLTCAIDFKEAFHKSTEDVTDFLIEGDGGWTEEDLLTRQDMEEQRRIIGYDN